MMFQREVSESPKDFLGVVFYSELRFYGSGQLGLKIGCN